MAFRDAPDLGTVAHEVTHVIQQSHGVHPQGGIGWAGDELERMADRVSIAVEQNKPVENLLNIGSRNELKPAEGYPPVQFFKTPESRPSPFTEGLPETEHTFEGDGYVRPLNDGNFDNIFYNRNKVIVVQFWDAHCRGPCGRMAHRISAVAEHYRTGPYADLVRLYHVQLDESADTGEIPNPRLSTRFGFESVPVTYFYYTATGRVPTNEAPLLEASIGGVVPTSDITWRIEHILQRHGHQRERPPVQVMRMRNRAGSPSGVAGRNVTPMQSPALRSAFNNNDNRGFFSLESPISPLKGLNTRYGQVTCLPPYAHVPHEVRIANCDSGCTRPSIQIHEETHVSDILECCRRWRAAARPVYSAQTINTQAALQLYEQWLDWCDDNRHYLEHRADRSQLAALNRLHRDHNCGQATSGNQACCSRINDWILQIRQSITDHQRHAGGGLTPCPWPATGVSGPPLIEQARECHGSGHLNQQETNIAGVEHKTVSRHISTNSTRIIQREEAGGTLCFPNAHSNVLMIYQDNPGNQIREVIRRLWQLSRPNTIHAAEAAVTILWNPQTRQPRFYSYDLGTEGQPNRVQICCPPQSEMQGAEIVGTIHTHPFPPSLAQQEPSGEDIQAVSQLPITSGRMENYIVGLEDIFVLFRDGRWFRIGRREQML